MKYKKSVAFRDNKVLFLVSRALDSSCMLCMWSRGTDFPIGGPECVGMPASSEMLRLAIDQNESVSSVTRSALWQCPEVSLRFLVITDTVFGTVGTL